MTSDPLTFERSRVAVFPHDVAAPLSYDRLPDVDGTVRVRLVGELDLITADQARHAVRRAQVSGRPVVCDLRCVPFVDLAGLRVLLDATGHARLTGSRLTIANCPPIVARILNVLGLDDALDIDQSPSPAGDV